MLVSWREMAVVILSDDSFWCSVPDSCCLTRDCCCVVMLGFCLPGDIRHCFRFAILGLRMCWLKLEVWCSIWNNRNCNCRVCQIFWFAGVLGSVVLSVGIQVSYANFFLVTVY